MPAVPGGFQAVYERNADDFVMVSLDVGPFFSLGTRNSALQLLSDLGITYPAAYAVSRDPSPCLEPTHCLLRSSFKRTVILWTSRSVSSTTRVSSES